MSCDRPIALRFPVALVLLIACLTTPAWADFETGMDAYQRGNYATALGEWRPLAEEAVCQRRMWDPDTTGGSRHFGFTYAGERALGEEGATKNSQKTAWT